MSSTTLETPPRKTRDLSSIYDNSQRIGFDDIADYALFSDADPIHFEEAFQEKKWRDAIDEEINSIMKNETWDLVDLSKNQNPIGVK